MKHLRVQNSEQESSLAALQSSLDRMVRLYWECDIGLEVSSKRKGGIVFNPCS